MSDQDKGLYNKYRITHRETGSEVEGACFVLRPERDPAARVALLRYAEATNNMELSADIWKWIQSIDPHAECSEDVYPLLDGTEVLLSPGDRVLFHRTSRESIPLTIDADSIIDDVLMAYGAALQIISQQREALEFYASEENNNWWIGGLDEVIPSEVMKDAGAKARTILKAMHHE
ncbi:hypothetical protein [Paenibacillus sp. 22594]|uniref:hypothetical protein n=1 Tax=Paenibacillus sp. 22594 TaxID=3453947 RepID=UPI003F842773